MVVLWTHLHLASNRHGIGDQNYGNQPQTLTQNMSLVLATILQSLASNLEECIPPF